MAPVTGSKSEGMLGRVQEFEGLNWSPKWRKDYDLLNQFRKKIYTQYFIVKLIYYPFDFFMMFIRGIFSSRYQTKGEMAVGWLCNKIKLISCIKKALKKMCET